MSERPKLRHLNHDILYVVGQLAGGGLERQLWLLLQSLDRHRFRTAVFSWSGKKDDVYRTKLEELGIPVYQGCGSSMAKLWMCFRVARKLRPAIIHSYSFYTNFVAFLCAQTLGIPSVGSIRSDFHHAFRSSGPVRGRLSALLPAHQISNNVHSVRTIQAEAGVFCPRHVYFVRNGIDLFNFAGLRDEMDMERGTNLPYSINKSTLSNSTFATSTQKNSAEVVILGVGSLLPIKRWDRLLRAASTLKRGGVKFRVTIAGEGPMRSDLEKLIRDLSLNDVVQLPGFVTDVTALLRNGALLVHTSESEGCPNAIMEAMACALPVVAVDSGDIPGLVEEGRTGFIVPGDDERILVARIKQLIENPHLRITMGRQARRKAEREFSLDRLIKETLDVYRRAGWAPVAAFDKRLVETGRSSGVEAQP